MTNELATENKKKALIETDGRGQMLPKNFEGYWRLAELFARSDLVPDHYKNKPENCLIAIQTAIRCQVDPMAYLQCSYIVHGKPAVEAKFAIAMLNASGKISGPIQYHHDGDGDSRSCYASVLDATSGEQIRGPVVTWDMVSSEGWDKQKKSQISKWVTMPGLMFEYRAAMFLIRTRYADLLLGIRSIEEMEDIATANAVNAVAVEVPDGDESLTVQEPSEASSLEPPELSEDEARQHCFDEIAKSKDPIEAVATHGRLVNIYPQFAEDLGTALTAKQTALADQAILAESRARRESNPATEDEPPEHLFEKSAEYE